MSHLTNDEIEILKYIKKHPHILRKNLIKKFPNIDDAQLSGYIFIGNQEPIITENGLDTGETEKVDDSDYFLSRNGILFLENLKDDKRKSYFTPITVTLITNLLIFIAKTIAQNIDKIISFVRNWLKF